MTTRRVENTPVSRRQIVLTVLVWLAAGVGHALYGIRHKFYDFSIYYKAIRWWSQGNDLYSYSQHDRIEGSLGFTYPPFAAIVLRPLTPLPLGVAQAVFSVISLSVLGLCVYWLVAPVADRLGYHRWLAFAFAMPLVTWLEPIRETVSFGQINLLLAVLVLVDLLIALPRGWRLAGIGIGLAAAIKLTPAIFVVYLLLTGRWRAAATATATATVATLLAATVAWRDSWQFWTSMLWDTGRIGHVERVANQSLLGTLARLARPDDPSQLLWAVLAALIIGYGFWRARSAALAGDEVTGLTLTGIIGSLVSPVTWSHHLFWFLPALVVIVDAVGRRARQRRGLTALGVTLYLATTSGVVAWYDLGLSRRVFGKGVSGFLIDNCYVLLMLALLIALPIRTRRTPTAPAAGNVRQGHGDVANRPLDTGAVA